MGGALRRSRTEQLKCTTRRRVSFSSRSTRHSKSLSLTQAGACERHVGTRPQCAVGDAAAPLTGKPGACAWMHGTATWEVHTQRAERNTRRSTHARGKDDGGAAHAQRRRTARADAHNKEQSGIHISPKHAHTPLADVRPMGTQSERRSGETSGRQQMCVASWRGFQARGQPRSAHTSGSRKRA